MKVRVALVLGGTGFCGRHLVKRLSNEGNVRVVVVGRRPNAPVACDDYVRGDALSYRFLESLLSRERPDWIFELISEGTQGAALFQASLRGTVALSEAVIRFVPSARVVLVGSAAEYGSLTKRELPAREDGPCRPRTDYGVAKLGLTLLGLYYARQGVQVAIARPFNVIGEGVPESLVVGALLGRIRAALEEGGASLVLGNVDTIRDFVAVEDVVDAYVRIVSGGGVGEIYNLCSGVGRSIRSVAELLVSWCPRDLEIQIDERLVRTDDVRVIYGDYRKAHRAFGFEPRVPFEQALRSAWSGAMSMSPTSPNSAR